MIHSVKCWPESFHAISIGTKAFELRLNDRNYNVGDTLELREYDPYWKAYSGRTCVKSITYVLTQFTGLRPGYAILSIE